MFTSSGSASDHVLFVERAGELLYATIRPFETRSRYGSGALHLNLATYHNSLARSTKSTWSLALPLLVSTGFQVLFHSPPGVLFTFPSRYYTLSVTK